MGAFGSSSRIEECSAVLYFKKYNDAVMIRLFPFMGYSYRYCSNPGSQNEARRGKPMEGVCCHHVGPRARA